MENKKRIYLPNVASFLISEACNLACTYCFELEGRENCNKHMTIEVARRGLEFLCENAIKNGEDYFSAMLFGGEPMLQPHVVEEILRYGLELGKKNNIFFEANMVTNATIFSKKISEMFKPYLDSVNFNVQLSVDGVQDIHDQYRVTKGGKGSFHMIERNIKGWKDLFKNHINQLSIHGCSNKETLPRLFENYKFFREEWDVPRLWFIPINDSTYTSNDVKIYEEQLTKIMDYVLERAKTEGSIKEVYNYAPLDKCLSNHGWADAPCGAGKNFVTITASGEVYPCHSFYYNDPEEATKIGDIWKGLDESRRKIFIEYDQTDMSCSKDNPKCDAFGCYRCIADNWTENGNMFSQIVGPKCKMSKVERKLQLKMKKELTKMGLMSSSNNNVVHEVGNNPDNPNCLCDVRTNDNDVEGYFYEQELYTEESNGQCDGSGSCDCECESKEKTTKKKKYKKDNEVAKNNVRTADTQGVFAEDSDEVIAYALQIILERLDSLEAGQLVILKKFLK